MGSLSACSLLPNTEVPKTKILTHNLLCKSLKSPFLDSRSVQKRHTLAFKFISSRNPSNSNLLRHASHSTSLTTPLSKLSHTYPGVQPHKNSSRILLEKVVGFVIGSVICIGCSNIRAAVALPAQTSSSGASLEEKRETQKGKSEDEEMYEKILEEDPRNVGALKVVLYGKMRRGSTKEAVKYVERLIEVEPDEVEWRLLLALCYEIMGQLSSAKSLFQKILEKRPLLLRALHGLALVMHKNHEGPAVFVMLNKALEIAQREKRVIEERNIRILIGQMHVVKGELEEGLNKFQDLITADPRDFRPYLCQGIIYSLLDQKKEAAEQFETYRALAPEEFPQRGFLDDVVLAAKTKSGVQFQDFDAEFSSRK